MTPEGAKRLYGNCDQKTDIMLEWLVWGMDQKYANNIAGLIINESTKNDKPFLSKKHQNKINNLLATESKKWANEMLVKLKEINPKATVTICKKIINSELAYGLPKNKMDFEQLINAVENSKYDLVTGDKIE